MEEEGVNEEESTRIHLRAQRPLDLDRETDRLESLDWKERRPKKKGLKRGQYFWLLVFMAK